ncbi:hypothetical protein [Frigidibacter sp. MR17.24]
MTIWEFTACLEGFAEFHTGKPPARATEMSDEHLRELGIEGFTDG